VNRHLATACLALMVSACHQAATVSPATAQAATARPEFNTKIPVIEVMDHVMDPAAYAFWGGSGTTLTRSGDRVGERDRSPRTEAEWKKVEDGAATVVLASNALMVDGYAREPVADWRRYAAHVGDVALKAKAAAEQKNKGVMMDIGSELDTACEACHKQFAPSKPPG
jgi:hypothetical protein